MKKLRSIIKVVHSELSDCLAEFPAMMWIALFLDCLLVLYMLLLGIDGILFPSRMTTLRMVIGGYGVVNAIFCLIAGYITCNDFNLEHEPPREDRLESRLERYEDRLERYEKVIAPMLVLFPLLAPMWAGFIVTLILAFICGIIYWGYKKLEDKVLR
jgi:hypothetical protein